MQNAPLPRISLWQAEFVDPAIEQAYRADMQARMAWQLRTALWVWAALVLLFALPDYLTMGASPAFWQLTAYRVCSALALLLSAYALRKRPHLAPQGRLAMGLELAGFPFFFLYLLLRPDLRATTIGMIMVINLSLFIFVPGRVALVAWVAACAIAGTIATLVLTGTPPGQLPGLLMLLGLPAVIGFISANRLQRAQRQEFVVRTRLRQTNAALQAEVARSAELQAELLRQATTDPLTGLPNRREFDRCFARDAARADREGSPLAVAVFDLDHFKSINDGYGHGTGDDVLRHVAQLARHCFRSVDSVGRIGGEEFAVLLPGASGQDAVAVAQRFVDRLGGTPVELSGFRRHVTATVGVAERQPGENTLDAVLRRADAALYEGKHSGRNRVVLASSDRADQEPA